MGVESTDDIWMQYFTAPWCVPCKTFGPILEEVTTALEIPVEKINIDDSPEKLPEDVFGVPTIIMFNKDKEMGRFTGAKTFDKLNEWLLEKVNG